MKDLFVQVKQKNFLKTSLLFLEHYWLHCRCPPKKQQQQQQHPPFSSALFTVRTCWINKSSVCTVAEPAVPVSRSLSRMTFFTTSEPPAITVTHVHPSSHTGRRAPIDGTIIMGGTDDRKCVFSLEITPQVILNMWIWVCEKTPHCWITVLKKVNLLSWNFPLKPSGYLQVPLWEI